MFLGVIAAFTAYLGASAALMLKYHTAGVSEALTYGAVYGMAAAAVGVGTGVMLTRVLRAHEKRREVIRAVLGGVALSGVALLVGLLDVVAGAIAASSVALMYPSYRISRDLGVSPFKTVTLLAATSSVIVAALTSWMVVPAFADNPIYALAIAFFVFIVGLKTGLGIGFAGFQLRRGITAIAALSGILIPAIVGLSHLVSKFMKTALAMQKYALLGHALLGLFLIGLGMFIARKWAAEGSAKDLSKLGAFIVAVPCPICLTGVALSVAMYAEIGALNVTQAALVLWTCFVSTAYATLIVADAIIDVLKVPPAVALSGLENLVGLLFVITGIIAWAYPLWKKAPKLKLALPGPSEIGPWALLFLALMAFGYLWAARKASRGEYPPDNPIDDVIRAVVGWLASRRR
ncbi:DUF2162 domain-containing protein [Methanopyrus sp.]